MSTLSKDTFQKVLDLLEREGGFSEQDLRSMAGLYDSELVNSPVNDRYLCMDLCALYASGNEFKDQIDNLLTLRTCCNESANSFVMSLGNLFLEGQACTLIMCKTFRTSLECLFDINVGLSMDLCLFNRYYTKVNYDLKYSDFTTILLRNLQHEEELPLLFKTMLSSLKNIVKMNNMQSCIDDCGNCGTNSKEFDLNSEEHCVTSPINHYQNLANHVDIQHKKTPKYTSECQFCKTSLHRSEVPLLISILHRNIRYSVRSVFAVPSRSRLEDMKIIKDIVAKCPIPIKIATLLVDLLGLFG